LTAGLKDRQTPMPVMHIVEILDAGYRHDGLYADGTFDIPAEDDTQTKAIVAGVLVLTLVLIGWVLKSLWKRK
ncbi:MAG: hypothetical protein KDI02_13860, partial [Anaerolineae bacterium]|nr:hypothetical protein [Anaerolineae bacterium]